MQSQRPHPAEQRLARRPTACRVMRGCKPVKQGLRQISYLTLQHMHPSETACEHSCDWRVLQRDTAAARTGWLQAGDE